jgi:hypothetical protein
VESCCELGNEPSGSIKCWELPSGCTSCGLSSGTQLHIVSWFLSQCIILVVKDLLIKHYGMKTYGGVEYRSAFSLPRRQLDVMCQLHGPIALPPRNKPPYSLDMSLELTL